MKWYRNLTIRGQLIFALVVVLSGFITVGITYGFSVFLEQNTRHETEQMAGFVSLVEKSHRSVVGAQRLEKMFGLTKDPKHLEEHAQSMIKLTEDLKVLKESVPDKDEITVVEEVNKSLQAYRKAFYYVNEELSILGLDAESGIRGSLNEAARDLERELANTGNPGLLTSLLQMRRHEKNYLLDDAGENIDKVMAQTRTFKKSISGSKLSNSKKSALMETVQIYQQDFADIIESTKRKNEFTVTLERATVGLESHFDDMLSQAKILKAKNDEASAAAIITMEIIFVAVLILAAVIVGFMFVLLMRKITTSLSVLMDTIAQLGEGNYEARTNLETTDELGQFGKSLDTMLDERLAGLAKAEKENDQVNDSIIEVIEAVSLLSEKDLTISVPVAEDVTGAVADSINQMARQTAAVLNNIRSTAEQVETAAKLVKSRGDVVTSLAENESKVVENTIGSLDKAAQTMSNISARAIVCNDIANKAAHSTDLAQQAVNNTVDGMADIREIISETEKRIKRLGERSQEINGIVDIINTVAERTHVLALNASMQAAAAGEAGRGFAVVADEVQRLAEGSRTSTSQISELVNSIQSETAETMNTMNKAITQVVDGSELAEQAGKQMAETKETTAELVAAVAEISDQSANQAKISNDIRKRAMLIQQSTQKTGKELVEQATQTESLVEFAYNMLESMREFKLPIAK